METCKLELVDIFFDNNKPYYKFKVVKSNNPKIIGQEFTIRGVVYQDYDGSVNYILPMNEFNEWLRKRIFYLTGAGDLSRAIIEGMEFDGYGVDVAYSDYEFLRDIIGEWRNFQLKKRLTMKNPSFNLDILDTKPWLSPEEILDIFVKDIKATVKLNSSSDDNTKQIEGKG